MKLNKEAKDLYYACEDMENHIYFINSRNDISKNGIKYYLKCLKEAIEKFEKSGWLENEVTEDEAHLVIKPPKKTNFDKELASVTIEELAYLRSHWTHCEDCPLVDECVKDELTCLDLWVRYLKEAAK